MKLEDKTQQESDIFQQAIGLAKENQRLALERERAEEQVISEAKFSSENPNPVLRIDGDNCLMYANAPALPLLNNKLLNSETSKIGDRVPLEFQKMSSHALSTQSIQQSEIKVGIQTFRLEWVPILNEGYVNVYGRDITERKKAEEKLIQATRQNELILLSAGEGIYGLNLDGKTTFTNPSAEKMLGYTKEELLDKPQHALIHHSNPDGSPYARSDCHIYAAFKDGKVHRESEEVFWRKNGTCFPVEYVSTPIRESNKLVGAVVTFKDITERKKAESQKLLQYELTKIFLGGQSLEKTIPKILHAVGEFMQWEISHYWGKNPPSEELHCYHGWNADYLNDNEAFKEFKTNTFSIPLIKGKGLPGLVWQTLEPFWIPDIRTNKNFPRAPFAKNLGMKSGFGFPIFSNNQFMGVIEIFTCKQYPQDDDLIQFMSNLGKQIGQWMHLKRAEEQLKKLNLDNLD
jgi:PAS domain S-box-containing protein